MNYLLLLFLMLSSSYLFAAGGYEKPSMWSPTAIGLGGAYSSIVEGGEAIQYNPSALGKNEFGVNVASLGGYLTAPMSNQKNETTNKEKIYSAGIVGSLKLSDKVGLGFGAYGLAGLNSTYDNVNYGGLNSAFTNYHRDNIGKLQVMEYSVGLSYKINPKFSIGASLRAQQFNAELSQTNLLRSEGLSGLGLADGTVLGASSVKFNDFKGSRFGSFRLGAQYKEENWGLGISYRSSVKGSVKGKSSGDVIYTADGANLINVSSGGAITPNSGSVYALNGSKAKLTTEIPQQLNIDGHYNIIPDKLRIALGYSWTNYSKNQQLKIKGKLQDTSTGQDVVLSSLNQKWKNMNDFKVGLSFLGDTSFHLGYVYTTAVTNKSYSSPISAPASPYHHYGASLNHKVTKSLYVDFALEYYHAKQKGHSEKVIANNMSSGGESGKYKTEAYGSYLGMRFHF